MNCVFCAVRRIRGAGIELMLSLSSGSKPYKNLYVFFCVDLWLNIWESVLVLVVYAICVKVFCLCLLLVDACRLGTFPTRQASRQARASIVTW